MEILFKREQTSGKFGPVHFKLWAKIELSEAEQAIAQRYKFDNTALIHVPQPWLLLKSLILALVIAALLMIFLYGYDGGDGGVVALFLGLCAGIGYHEHCRETVYVRDLLNGRHFRCTSVVELARKEAWLYIITGFLRQVMESATQWDDTEALEIEPLPKEEARRVIVEGL